MGNDYEVGDTVCYENFMGQQLTGVVIAKWQPELAGVRGFDIDGYWGYDDQIIWVRRNIQFAQLVTNFT